MILSSICIKHALFLCPTGRIFSQQPAGTDELTFNGNHTFTPCGPKEKNFTANVTVDSIALEANEIVNVTLTIDPSVPGVTYAPISSTIVTIIDDECKFSTTRNVLFGLVHVIIMNFTWSLSTEC